jgi:hypothetical protein
MSKHEFMRAYIWRASCREVVLSVALTLVSGGALAASAEIPGADGTIAAAKAVAGLSVSELLALVTLGSLALNGYMIRLFVGESKKGTVALTQIADKLSTMKCVDQGKG